MSTTQRRISICGRYITLWSTGKNLKQSWLSQCSSKMRQKD